MKNPIEFPIGAIIRSVYSGEVYEVARFNKNGMCDLRNLDSGCLEGWNAYNNRHFIDTTFIEPIILISL